MCGWITTMCLIIIMYIFLVYVFITYILCVCDCVKCSTVLWFENGIPWYGTDIEVLLCLNWLLRSPVCIYETPCHWCPMYVYLTAASDWTKINNFNMILYVFSGILCEWAWVGVLWAYIAGLSWGRGTLNMVFTHCTYLCNQGHWGRFWTLVDQSCPWFRQL